MLALAAAIIVGGHLVADEMNFPEILDAGIPGTPKLGQPFLVTGGSSPILTEKHGLAAPALWDWNGDGKRDHPCRRVRDQFLRLSRWARTDPPSGST